MLSPHGSSWFILPTSNLQSRSGTQTSTERSSFSALHSQKSSENGTRSSRGSLRKLPWVFQKLAAGGSPRDILWPSRRRKKPVASVELETPPGLEERNSLGLGEPSPKKGFKGTTGGPGCNTGDGRNPFRTTPCRYQQTLWFQPWFQGGAISGFRNHHQRYKIETWFYPDMRLNRVNSGCIPRVSYKTPSSLGLRLKPKAWATPAWQRPSRCSPGLEG